MIAMETLSHNPVKSTTGSAGYRRALRCVAGRMALGAFALLIAVGAGCSTARNRESPSNIVGNLRFRDSDTEARFSRTYRSGSLYQDFRTALLVDAIAMDLEYRRGYVSMMRKTYLLSDGDTAAMWKQQEQDFDSSMALLVFVYGGDNRPVPLGEQVSPWKVLLQDDDGQLLTPGTIERLRPENSTFQYLSLYFYGLDRWSQAFKISFPKLNKVVLRQAVGKKPIELVVTGLPGTVRLVWQDPRVFYGPTEGVPAAGARPRPER